jgi:hypothetical protein
LAQCLLLCAHLGLKTNDVFLLAKLRLTQSAQLACTLKRGLKTLHAKTGTVLARLLTKLLLAGKLILGSVKRRLIPTSANIPLLRTQIALALCLNNCLPGTAESPGANRLRLIGHALHF